MSGRGPDDAATGPEAAAVRALEAHLRMRDEELHLALRAGHMGTWRWDAVGRDLRWDAELHRIYGLEPGAFGGTFRAWMSLLHPEDRAGVRGTIEAAIAAGDEGYEDHARAVWPDGSVHWMEGTGRILRDEAGAFLGTVGVVRDVTARQEADDERERLLAAAERSATSLARLHALGAALAAAATTEEVCDAVAAQALAATGAAASSLVVVDRDAEHADVVRTAGHPPGAGTAALVAALAADPLRVPVGVALRRGELTLVEDGAEVTALAPVMGHGFHAHAGVPLDAGEGHRAALGLDFTEPQAFDGAQRAQLAAVATEVGDALARARLYDRSRAAVDERERAAARLARLAEASLALTATLSVDELLDRITSAARDVVGCRAAAVHLDEEQGSDRDRDDAGAAPGDGAAGEPTLVVPLRGPDGARLGVVRCCGPTRGRFTTEDEAVLVQLAQLASVAMQNARLFGRAAEVARGLQAALLPPTLPTIPGVDLGARYVAAGGGAEVGGDFYDAIPVGPGRWLLAVGDVCGKGVAAAAVTGLARHTLRSAAVVEWRPSRLVAHLNAVLLRSPELTPPGRQDPLFCTVAVVAVERHPDGVHVTVASGGHPLPLVARAAGPVEPLGRVGTLVGLFPEVEVHDVATVLDPGDRLVLYTDGISERRCGGAFLGEDGIAEVLTSTAGATADATAAAVEARARDFASTAPVDDMAVLVLRADAVTAAPAGDDEGDRRAAGPDGVGRPGGEPRGARQAGTPAPAQERP